MNNTRIARPLPLVLMACFLFLILVFFNNTLAAPGSAPLLDDPTPTPTVIAFWEGNTQGFSWTHADGNNACLDTGGWVAEVASGGVGCPEIVAPEDNYPGGILVKLISNNYNGDVRLVEQTNQDWVKKFNDVWDSPPVEMTVGETLCVGTSGACSAAGYAVDADSDWEGYTSTGDINHLEDVHIGSQLGSAGGVSYEITPIYYGLVMDPDGLFCRSLTPDNTDEVRTGTLLGTDEVGHIIEDLIEGEEYLLYTEDGPWNDGTDSRYDIAIRFFDGTDWGEFAALDEYADEGADPKDVCDDEFLDSANNAALTFVATEDTQKIQLRVNDEEGQFTDNDDHINYVFSTAAPGFGQGCDNYWQLGDEILSITIDADTSAWQSFLPYTEEIVNGVYGLVVDGTYTDDGETDNTIAVANFSDAAGSWQYDYVDSNLWIGLHTCDLETDEYKEYYGNSRITFYDWDYTYGMFMTPYARVEDDTGDFSNNAGTIDASIYESEYIAPPSDCATTYSKGQLLEVLTVDAQSSNGLYWPQLLPKLNENSVYYLEPITGYSYGGEDTSYSFEIKPNALALGSWQDDDYYADCVTQVDHERYGYYFRTDIDLLPSLNEFDNGDFMWIRSEAPGGIYPDNQGVLQVELWGAVDNEVPEDEDCSDYYNASTLVYTDTFAADSSAGYSIDHSVFTPDQIYKIVVEDDDFDIRRSYAGSGAVEYDPYLGWDGKLCSELDDGDHVVFFEAQALSDYEIRNSDYDTDSGTNTFKVYTTTTLKAPMQGCEYRDYGDIDKWYWIIADEQVSANNSGTGEDLSAAYLLANALDPDSNYKIITSGGPWTSSGAPYSGYDLDISTDGGSTWQLLTDWLDCVIEVEDHIRGYKSDVSEDGPFLLRISDPEELWINNSGSITINLYTDQVEDDANDTRYDPAETGIDGYSYGCTAKCYKPETWLQVGQYIEYARCRIVSYLAWCPWHTQDLSRIRQKFLGIEPFTTILELVDLGRAMKAEVDTYTWVDDSGGEDVDPAVQSPRNYIFMPGEGGGADIPLVGEDTIWGSGEIDLTAPTSGTTYSTECDNILADSLGTRLAAPVCFVFNIMDRLGLLTWVQMLWDLAMLFALFWYIKKNWVDNMQ